MMTLRPDPDEHTESPLQIPTLVSTYASLSPLEKSLLAHFLVLTSSKVIVEIGVYRAVSTAFIIEFLELNQLPGTVYGFDMPEVVEQLRREHPHVAKWEASGRLKLIPGELPGSLKEWVRNHREYIDLALIDARHDYPSVKWELKLIWPHLAEDGVILGHDYVGEWPGVRYAFDDFASEQGAMLLPLRSARQADTEGRRSVLVAMRRPTYERHIPEYLSHRWEGFKADVVRGDLLGKIWKRVRPLFRRS